MSLASGAVAIKAFLKKMELAQDMATAGAVGSVFYSVLCDANALLNLIDQELADVDRERHASLFATTPMLRGKLDRLREAVKDRHQFGLDPADRRPQDLSTAANAVLIVKLYREHCAACEAAGVGTPSPERWVDLIDDMLRS